MNNVSREQVFLDLRAILDEMPQNWEYSEEISLDTLFFEDLGLESIDVVVFEGAIEEHYKQTFPFMDFLADISEREAKDIRIGDVVDFIFQNLGVCSPVKEGGRDI